MTKEDLIAMARQAGAFPELSTTSEKDVDFLRRFASLVSARTREECAKVCDAWSAKHASDSGGCTYNDCDFVAAAHDCAAAIRAMGERT